MSYDNIFWKSYAITYDRLLKYPPYVELLQKMVQEIASFSKPGQTILDVGTGTGNLALALGKLGFEVVGIDYSDAMLKRAEQKRKRAKLGNVHFEKGDLENVLRFLDCQFDCISSLHTLYTLKDSSVALKESYRILAQSGQIVISEFQHPIQIFPAIKEGFRKYGFKVAMRLLPELLLLIAPFNVILRMRQEGGEYHYWLEQATRSSLAHVGFRITKIEPTYTNDWDLFVVAKKPSLEVLINRIRIVSAETDDDMNSVLRLRYEIYCKKLGYKPLSNDGHERDEYDDYAKFALALDEGNRAIGTVRLIFDNPQRLPIESQPEFGVKEYRSSKGIVTAVEASRLISINNRREVLAGLFKWVFEQVKREGIQDIFATAKESMQHHILEYEKIGFRKIGVSNRYEQLGGDNWIPMHLNIPNTLVEYRQNPGYDIRLIDFITGYSNSLDQK